MVVCSITAAVEQLLLFVIRSEILRFVNRAMTDSSTSSAQCVICDELVQGSETIRVEDEAMTILVRAKKRQNVKWQPANNDFLIVHALCAEIYTRCSFASNVISGIPVRTLSRLSAYKEADCSMTNANQKQPLVFWPTTNDQNENPHCRSRRDSNKILPNKLRTSEEDLLNKEYLANRSSYPYSRVARFYNAMPEKLFKIIIVGDPTVGKTAFVQRYVSNIFKREFKSTVGVDFSLKILHYSDSQTVKLQLWDIAGQERFTWMTRVYYKDAHSCIIMFDLSSRSSFHNTLKWKEDVDAKCSLPDGSPIPCMLLGNKCDLSMRQIDQMEIETFAKEHNFIGWTEVSAKEGLMVHDSMKFLVDTMLIQENIEIDGLSSGGIEPLKLGKEQKPKSYCSC